MDAILPPLAQLREQFADPEWRGALKGPIPTLPEDLYLHYAPNLTYGELARSAIDKLLLSRWSDYTPARESIVTLFTWVIPSGLGDFAMQLYVADLIHKALPNVTLQLITILEEGSTGWDVSKLPYTCEIVRYRHPHLPNFSDNISEKIANSALVLQLPTYYPRFEDVLAIKGPRITSIGEYSFLDSPHFHPRSGNRTMGLHPFEMGIMTLDPIPKALKDPGCFFAYLITERGASIYLHTLLAFTKELHNTISLYTTSLTRLLPILEKEDLSGYHLKEITIIDDGKTCSKPIESEGRRLVIRSVKNKTPIEIRQIMAHCHPFMACRGDGSFTEALSVEATFFYDFLPHARPFLRNLLKLAQRDLMAYPTLEEYLTLMMDETPEPPKTRGAKLAGILLDPTLRKGMLKLKELIYERHSCSDHLINLVKQEIAYHKNPKLELEQNNRIEALQSGKVSLGEILKSKPM